MFIYTTLWYIHIKGQNIDLPARLNHLEWLSKQCLKSTCEQQKEKGGEFSISDLDACPKAHLSSKLGLDFMSVLCPGLVTQKLEDEFLTVFLFNIGGG
jgi:hypothetical protein